MFNYLILFYLLHLFSLKHIKMLAYSFIRRIQFYQAEKQFRYYGAVFLYYLQHLKAATTEMITSFQWYQTKHDCVNWIPI